jgi:hypothetical protein
MREIVLFLFFVLFVLGIIGIDSMQFHYIKKREWNGDPSNTECVVYEKNEHIKQKEE